MDETEIIRLNIERYRRLLQIETDESKCRDIKRVLGEFEQKAASTAEVASRRQGPSEVKGKYEAENTARSATWLNGNLAATNLKSSHR